MGVAILANPSASKFSNKTPSNDSSLIQSRKLQSHYSVNEKIVVMSSKKKLAIGSSKNLKLGILSKKQKPQDKPASTKLDAHGCSPLLSAANKLPDGI